MPFLHRAVVPDPGGSGDCGVGRVLLPPGAVRSPSAGAPAGRPASGGVRSVGPKSGPYPERGRGFSSSRGGSGRHGDAGRPAPTQDLGLVATPGEVSLGELGVVDGVKMPDSVMEMLAHCVAFRREIAVHAR